MCGGGAKERKKKKGSAAVGCYRRSVHPSLSACGSGRSAAEGVEVDWQQLAVSPAQQRAGTPHSQPEKSKKLLHPESCLSLL